MPDNVFIQYGSFGLVVFIVAWFVLRGFPQMVAALTASIERVLSKIDSIEADCREERREMLKTFRDECEANRRSFRDECDMDRKARHDQGTLYQSCLAEMGLTQAKHDRNKSQATGN